MNSKRIADILDYSLPVMGLTVVILNAINGWWIVTGIWVVVTIMWTLFLLEKIKYVKERKEMEKEWEEIMNLPDRGGAKK